MDFTECSLKCQLVECEGAHVLLNRTYHQLGPDNDSDAEETLPEDELWAVGIALLVHGAGTSVQTKAGFFRGGVQAVCVQARAPRSLHSPVTILRNSEEFGWTMDRFILDNWSFIGIEVCGDGSTLELRFADVHRRDGGHYGVHVHSNAKVVLHCVDTGNAEYRVRISSPVPALLKRCQFERVSRAGTLSYTTSHHEPVYNLLWFVRSCLTSHFLFGVESGPLQWDSHGKCDDLMKQVLSKARSRLCMSVLPRGDCSPSATEY